MGINQTVTAITTERKPFKHCPKAREQTNTNLLRIFCMYVPSKASGNNSISGNQNY